MGKNTCILHPEAPNGEPSGMYNKLLEILKNRPLANWFYAAYKTNNSADHMDQAGMKRNLQGEHKAEDVLKFFDYASMEKEIANLPLAEYQLGAVDSNGKRIDFTNAEDALQKADNFNNSHSGLMADVVKRGDNYNIIVSEKNSRTNTKGDDIKSYLKTWDIYKHAFNAVGVDITSLPSETQNVVNALNTNLATYLKNLGMMNIKFFNKKDLMLLFSLSPNSPHVRRLTNAFGSLENAAQAIEDFNQGIRGLTTAQQTLLMRAFRDAQKFNGIDMDALQAQIKGETNAIKTSSKEEEIKVELKRLNKKYKIDIEEIHRVSDKIDSLSEAATEAALTLQRQIRLLEKEKGNNAEGRRLETILNNLMKELTYKRYYSGLLNFLGEASAQVANIDAMLQNIPQTGTELEKAFGTARILQNIKSLKEQYYPVITALADPTINIDENISKQDVDNIRQTAKDLKEFFDGKSKILDAFTESTMINILTEIIGDHTPDGQSIINAVRMAAVDSKQYDILYSMGRASNPIVAAAGSIIRNAQDERDEIINKLSLRIRRATDKLYKAGFNSEFMYESEGHIISDIDWALYESARKQAIKAINARGLKGFDKKQAIEDWEQQNTEDRIVNTVDGRTERVPNASYRKTEDFMRNWSEEQKEYYKTMMQIKGEIGSLLPAYAQRQYLPPQVRRNFLDALDKANNYKDVWKAIKNKFENLYTVREDDENYSSNGIIDGENYQIVESDFDNTPLRQIPIFFVNRVEEGELLKNFSSGLTALAGTAINYRAMENIAQVVEFMGDFVNSKATRDNKAKSDMIQDKEVRVFKDLWKRGRNTNTHTLMEGFIAQHIYGQKRDPNENKKLSKLFDNIVAYTSFRGLATNFKGAVANYLMGEFQMMIEAGAGEFYGFKDYLWAHNKLAGSTGAYGDMAELLTNNVNHIGVLLREKFDPLQENFATKGHTKYYSSMFRQLMSHDCSFIGYSSGEYFIHYVNMYAVLHNQKVLLNGKKICLFDAYEVTNKQDGNSELKLKQGVTDLDGNAITDDFIDKIRKKIRYVNQTTHGSMNEEDKGLLHQKWWGRGIMNFRQWMVEHYSRRFRARHFDATLGEDREGYWYSLYKGLFNDDTKDTWKKGDKMDALEMFMKDLYTFTFRSEAQWSNLDDMQKYNVKRARAEILMYIALLGLSFALGEPDEHKKEFWRRWWIYQTKRAIVDTEASMPQPKAITSIITILQSPMASVNMMSSLLYMFYGLTQGDVFEEIKSGDHKGENKYWRNVVKYDLPFFKDIEQIQKMDTDDAIFKVFDASPSNH
jgi:hypothetical protein